jgi:acyl-coenzyme A synthetase/AMP-(fatty) acid ligase
MSADYIAFHAIERPDAVALVDHGRTVTFAACNQDIRNLTRALGELGVPRGGSVALGCDEFYAQWLLLLALERLGIATASFGAGEGTASASLLASVDLALSEPHFPAVGARRHHAITGEWLTHVLALDADDHVPALPCSPDDPVRILRTSGTTGSPKRLLHPRSLHDAWVTRWIVLTGLTHRSRLLLTMSFTVNGMYACATACLRAGGTVVAVDLQEPRDIALAISGHAITTLILAPIQIARVLDALPEGFVKPPSLTICSFGAAVSGALRSRALTLLATELIDMYGSNEAGFISSTSSRRDDGIGAVWPGVRVEIVDERDVPLPLGQMGKIRVKTPDMVQGYLGDPEATSRMFKDGWFYPGDLGILHESRRLQIIGRGDDLLNFGGHKLPPEALERAILKTVTLGDIGVWSVRNADGIEELFVGVCDAGFDDRELLTRVTEALRPFHVGGFHAVRLPRIPRNANGKIQRDLLKSMVASGTTFSP